MGHLGGGASSVASSATQSTILNSANSNCSVNLKGPKRSPPRNVSSSVADAISFARSVRTSQLNQRTETAPKSSPNRKSISCSAVPCRGKQDGPMKLPQQKQTIGADVDVAKRFLERCSNTDSVKAKEDDVPAAAGSTEKTNEICKPADNDKFYEDYFDLEKVIEVVSKERRIDGEWRGKCML